MMIRDEPALNIPIHELSEEKFAAFKADFVKPFKLDTAPLYRLAIVKTPARVSLFVDVHHLGLRRRVDEFVPVESQDVAGGRRA